MFITMYAVISVLALMMSASNAFSVIEGTETFDGTSEFDLTGWTNADGLGFNGSGQYVLEDDGSVPVSLISRVVGSGDMECLLKFSSLTWGSSTCKVAWEFWDNSTVGSFDNMLIHLIRDNLIVYKHISGVLSIHSDENIGVAPSAINFRVVWQESSKEWLIFYGVNGATPTQEVLGGGVTNYSSSSASDRRMDIFCDQWDSNGTVRALLDYWSCSSAFSPSPTPTPIPGMRTLVNDHFNVAMEESSGGIMSFKKTNDAYDTNYVIGKTEHPEFNVDDSRWLGDIVIKYRIDGGAWHNARTSLSDDIRQMSSTEEQITISYLSDAADANGIQNFELVEAWQLEGDALIWEMTFKNTSASELELGDIALPLPFNQYWPNNQQEIYEKRVLRHSFIGLDGAYFYVQRPNGIAPFLVMMTLEGTSLEYYDRDLEGTSPFGMVAPAWEGLYRVYIHSKASGSNFFFTNSSVTLQDNEEVSYGFEFKWADDYESMNDVLYNNGLIGVSVAPGMVVPSDLYAMVDLHTAKTINSLTSNYPNNTVIEYVGKKPSNHHIYRISFSHPTAYPYNNGLQNTITVDYGNSEKLPLQLIVTEPLETLIKKRSDFIVNRTQQNDPVKWAYRAFLMWDILETRQITMEQDGYLPPFFLGGADDIGFAPPLFLSYKNVLYPDHDEITALDNYLSTHIWGYMQINSGPDKYACVRWYPLPGNNYARAYNYFHTMNLWYHHYLIEKLYGMTDYLTAQEYLLRAYETAVEVYTRTDQFFDGGKKLGNMGENSVPRIITSLQDEGFTAEAGTLAAHWNTKVEYFDGTEYPFGSEMYQDSTGFEASYALAKDGDRENLVERTHRANLANRGWQPAWFHYGGDNRWMGDSHYQLSYMTQLAGWALLDYALNDPSDKQEELVRRAYGAWLGSWANIHSSKDANDGAAKWVFHVENGPLGWTYWDGEIGIGHYGALLAASSVVVDDPLFDLFGYGCNVDYNMGVYHVTPRDGVRQRLHMVNLGLSTQLNRDGFLQADGINISDDIGRIGFVLENRTLDAHTTSLSISGLPAGFYSIQVDGSTQTSFDVDSSESVSLDIDIGVHSTYPISITRDVDNTGLWRIY